MSEWYRSWNGCNRCGEWRTLCTSDPRLTCPAADRNYYGRLCRPCLDAIGRAAEPDPLELARMASDGCPNAPEESDRDDDRG